VACGPFLEGISACGNTDKNALKSPLVGDCVAHIDILLSSDWQQEDASVFGYVPVFDCHVAFLLHMF
jgi:hypothetical protein